MLGQVAWELTKILLGMKSDKNKHGYNMSLEGKRFWRFLVPSIALVIALVIAAIIVMK